MIHTQDRALPTLRLLMNDPLFPLFGQCEKCYSYNLELSSSSTPECVWCTIYCLMCGHTSSSTTEFPLRDAELNAFAAWARREKVSR